MKPKQNDVEKAREIIKKFDPSLVIAAVQQLSIKTEHLNKTKDAIKSVFDSIDKELPEGKDPQYKMEVLKQASAEAEMEVMAKEIDNIKNEISKLDQDAVKEVLKDFFGEYYWGTACLLFVLKCTPAVWMECNLLRCGPKLLGKIFCLICINKLCFPDCGAEYIVCPKQGFDQLEYMGLTQMKAGQVLEISRGASAVVGVGGRTGFAGLCVDTVNCTGKSIQVMSKCSAALYSFDVGIEGVINPADAVLKLSQSHPALHKRVSKMIEEMKAKGEI